MKNLSLLAAIASIFVLSGCGGSVHRHVDFPPPVLEAFYIVDSYGVDTDLDPFTQPVLDPFFRSGLFEVFWEVDNEDGYFVELSINDRPSLTGREVIADEYCGPGQDCDFFGEFFCEYNADLTMSCDLPTENFPGQRVEYFGHLVDSLPASMYLILDICDTNSDVCEFQILDVVIE